MSSLIHLYFLLLINRKLRIPEEFLDLKNAFDTVDHDLLLKKYKDMELDGCFSSG